jgi:hypothetical protein
MEQNLGAIGAVYNLTMDPFEKYDMAFNGAVATSLPQPSPGKYAGQDNGWVLALIYPVMIEFNKSIIEYPSIKRFPGGASNDLRPDLQRPDNPVPLLEAISAMWLPPKLSRYRPGLPRSSQHCRAVPSASLPGESRPAAGSRSCRASTSLLRRASRMGRATPA